MTKEELLSLVNETEMPQIRVGETHRFNDIWVVVADGRLFCRQYSFSERSWYHAFHENPSGAIKCGDTVVKVKGVIPDDLDEINPKINEAYLEKHANKFTRYSDIARQMTEARYMERTMELSPVIDE